MQLREMISSLRSECGLSTNVAHGLNDRDSLAYLLDRTQIDLWESFDWPYLTIDRDIPLVVSQADYAYPTDLEFDGINTIWVIGSNQLYRLTYGIRPIDEVS